ncbi:glycosyltransferase family 4 protein [Candidatus Falkowbacteria bacterium]|uniref:Glycosyltransferase family 1 protein n=1 Tax=Candidatus Buchananbacteria bacterium CG10_big_fil_rev_8_21_14_0_10_33_19 TaxID=1974525 RepID=A0A2H0W2S2_9BACT|nr:glycosyltransferase family 4 protein [Candidatus Falkowbacteria bacterium]PIS05659.1 MAG: hypothetical protein COT80_02685 [Candidatus Buchananbacteria bacterium CG10_big_fil_rev_8_21_14_0_10_33_19]
MRIGIDCRTILNVQKGERAGVGHYTYFLVKNLIAIDKINSYVLFFDDRLKEDVEEFRKYSNVTVKFFPFYRYKKYLPIVYSQLFVSFILNQENLDIYHSPANVIPFFYNKKSVVTVHDLGIYKYPEFFPRKSLSRQWLPKKIFVPNSLKKSEIIIAVSKNTKKDIIEQFNISEEKIEVIYEGRPDDLESCSSIGDFQIIADKYGIGGKFVLFLGTIEPRKNIVNLIKAFRSLHLSFDSPLSDYQLIIAGNQGWDYRPIYQTISDANASILGIKNKRTSIERRNQIINIENERRSGSGRRKKQPIKYIGYVTHDEKIGLLCNSKCFVFPSFYEGFGLPVLEAMSLGVPVITSNLSSLPEITGEDGAILINPNKESEISEAIHQIITNETTRELLIKNGLKRADHFHWRKCARETIAIYNSIK